MASKTAAEGTIKSVLLKKSARRHNENIDTGRVDYLNKFSVAKKKLNSRSYECSKK